MFVLTVCPETLHVMRLTVFLEQATGVAPPPDAVCSRFLSRGLLADGVPAADDVTADPRLMQPDATALEYPSLAGR